MNALKISLQKQTIVGYGQNVPQRKAMVVLELKDFMKALACLGYSVGDVLKQQSEKQQSEKP